MVIGSKNGKDLAKYNRHQKVQQVLPLLLFFPIKIPFVGGGGQALSIFMTTGW